MATCHYPYTLHEDIQILRYLLDGDYVSLVKGNSIWKKMEGDGILQRRSWQSLKNRFKRNIMQDCSRPEYGLTEEEITSLKVHLSKSLANTPCTKSRRNIDPRLVVKMQEKRDSNKQKQKDNKAEELRSQEDKAFYSMDMNWTDSDSD